MKPKSKSAVTNGALLPGLDGRTLWARRCRDLLADHLSDLGGPDHVTAAESALVKRAVVLATELEIMEARFAAAGGASADELDVYGRGTGHLRRLLETLGLDRRARPIETARQTFDRLYPPKPEAAQ
jgi:hypothetical protein